MKKSKKESEKNRLEQLLIRWKNSFDANQTKWSQFILVFVAVIVAVWLFRAFAGKTPGKHSTADVAYYAATAEIPPKADLLLTTADSYETSSVGATLYAQAGDAFLRNGVYDASRVRSRASVGNTDPESAKPDPLDKFASALDAYSKAQNSPDVNLRSRANYGAGISCEDLASVSPEADVVAKLDDAKTYYEKVDEKSPYYSLAKTRLAFLARESTVGYYKAVARKYAEAAAEKPSDEKVLSGNNELNVGESVNVSDFGLNSDEAPAAESAPADEAPAAESAPVDEAPADEASAAESAPASETPAE